MVYLLLASTAIGGAAHDLTRLPLGDNRLSNSPRAAWIWPCHIKPGAGGAHRQGPWIRSDGTFDFTAKAVVPGSVSWPSRLNISLQGDRRLITTNGYPTHATGTFPIPPESVAFQYDRNPNRIMEQHIVAELPANPVPAAQPSCVPGAAGVMLSGVPLFNALDAPGRDAVAHETQDACQGHPQRSGVYHYHSVSTCVENTRSATQHSPLVGYMLDGFGIFGRHGEGGRLLTSADLDECHGHTHRIEWDGKPIEMYHYHATWDFPYTAGCMRGTYRMSDVMRISGPPPEGPPPKGFR